MVVHFRATNGLQVSAKWQPYPDLQNLIICYDFSQSSCCSWALPPRINCVYKRIVG